MKVLLLSRFYPFVGGREVTVENLAASLGESHEVHVLTPDAGKVITEKYALHRNLDPDETLCLIEKIRPDLIHVHAFYLVTNRIIQLAKKLGIPIILTLHGDLLNYGTAMDIKHFKSTVLDLDRVVAVCDHGRKELVGSGIDPPRVTVIPNGIHLERFGLNDSKKELRDGFGLPSDTFLFLTPARFMEKKGLEFLLDAIAQGNIDGAKFVLSAPASRTSEADREYAHKLWSLAEAKGVTDKLQVILTDPTAMPFLFNAVDTMVLPSETEQSPLAIIEAMASGTPVIATDVGGVPELVENGVTGLLTRYGDTPHLIEALLTIKTNDDIRSTISKNAFTRANGENSIQAMTKAYTKLYQSLI